MPSTLIIIRGNSGSGKTTVAKELRSRLGDGLTDNTLLVQQDIVRRDMLRERDLQEKRSTIELIELLVAFGRSQGRIVILEGILYAEKYGDMLKKLAGGFDTVYAYYFDMPFQETLARHATKPNAHEFGETEMRAWWKERDYLGLPNEKILHANMSAEDVVEQMVRDIEANG